MILFIQKTPPSQTGHNWSCTCVQLSGPKGQAGFPGGSGRPGFNGAKGERGDNGFGGQPGPQGKLAEHRYIEYNQCQYLL